MPIRTDLNQYDFHTINVHLDTNTNEWRADWHTYQMLVPSIGTDTFPNVPWIIQDIEQRVAEKGYVLASFHCTCPSCKGEPYTPVQNFIERLYTLRNNTREKLGWDIYEAMVDVAGKHQVSYGEENIADLIHYLDELSKLPGIHPYAKIAFREQAKDLQWRMENRMSREADEQAQHEAEQEALAGQ